MFVKSFVVFSLFLNLHSSSALWSCSSDTECSSLEGGVCQEGVCGCPPTQQTVNGATKCVDIAPYHFSECYENYQCSRLQLRYHCFKESDEEAGTCRCLPGSHYFLGRCWESKIYGDQCTTNEECIGLLKDPYSLSCQNSVCGCSDGYYLRQTGECRKIGFAVGDGCVLNEDCQFANGACDINTFTCYDSSAVKFNEFIIFQNAYNFIVSTRSSIQTQPLSNMAVDFKMAARNIVSCDGVSDCSEDMGCLDGACVCPVGYYSIDGVTCLAELGSPAATEDKCTGLLAEVKDGLCVCPSNFFYEENMRDCIKVARTFTDACSTNETCWTFGVASVCGDPQDPWGVRNCECQSDLAVQDNERNMCRLFAGLGEVCEVDSDCLAGDLEVLCVGDDEGVKTCACPDGLTIFEGLCLSGGLGLGDSCQVTQECTGFENSECLNGVCSCASGYESNNAICVSVLGGSCTSNSDCFTDNSVCHITNGNGECQCDTGFINYEEQCLQVADTISSPCNVTDQCTSVLGEGSLCLNGQCDCVDGYHFRGGMCWPMTGLFEACSRTSECYLNSRSEVVVCRNGLCQCDFDFPFLEELQTCLYSSASIFTPGALILIIATTLFYQ